MNGWYGSLIIASRNLQVRGGKLPREVMARLKAVTDLAKGTPYHHHLDHLDA